MSDTGKQSPLGINVLGSIMQNTGFHINPVAKSFMGESKTNEDYKFGTLVKDTCLRPLVWAINDGFLRKKLTASTYDNLISIGKTTLPAFGNSPPYTFVATDPTGEWSGEATTGYYLEGNIGQGQDATWIPYNSSNPNAAVTQWGFLRCFPLQAWNEFNWNGMPTGTVNYRDFVSTIMTVKGFIDYTNVAINASYNSTTFLEGVYSNMNDLITAEITGISLSLREFGQDCITAGRAIDLSQIDRFGLPSVLLQTIKKNNALTPSLSLALVSSGLEFEEIETISLGIAESITPRQQKQIYGAFLVTTGIDLLSILISLNCKTPDILTLADLLDLKKLFPNSYKSLTVPLYNTDDVPTNSKTYYPIYDGTGVNSRLTSPNVKAQVGTIIPPGVPPVSASVMQTELALQPLPEGFGSYLEGILPASVGIPAGAFSFSMQQVKNIQYIEFEKFSQIVKSLETTKSLDKIGGIKVPVDLPLANKTIDFMGIGSGPKNTLTFSDFYGCMSGLPYLWDDIYKGLKNYQTTKLNYTYTELFLAVSWEPAVLDIAQETGADTVQTWREPVPNPDYNPEDPGSGPEILDPGQPGIYNLWYTVTFTVKSNGGGYGRGGAPEPIVSLFPNNCGATITTTIGTDDTDMASNGKGSFGRVSFVIDNGTKFYYANKVKVWGPPPNPYPPKETVSVEKPPTAILIVPDSGKPTGGANIPGDSYNVGGTATSSTGEPTGDPTATPTSSGEIVLVNGNSSTMVRPDEPAAFTITNGVPDDTVNWSITSKPTGYSGTSSGSATLDSTGAFAFAPITLSTPGSYIFSFAFTDSEDTRTVSVNSQEAGYDEIVTAPERVKVGDAFSISVSGGVPNSDADWIYTSQPEKDADLSKHSFVLDSTGKYTWTGLKVGADVLYGIQFNFSGSGNSKRISVQGYGSGNVVTTTSRVGNVSTGTSTNSSSYTETLGSSVLGKNKTGYVTMSSGMPSTGFSWKITRCPSGSNGNRSGNGNLNTSGNGSIEFNFDTLGEYVLEVTFNATGHVKTTSITVVEKLYSWTLSVSPANPTVNTDTVISLSSVPANANVNWKIFTKPNGARADGGQFVADDAGELNLTYKFTVPGFYNLEFSNANGLGSNSIQFTVT